MSQALTTDSLNNPTVKGLNTDLASHLQNKEIWTYARNAVLNSHAGNMYALQNEQSNIFCADLPYTFIGSIPLIENKFAIFTTDNVNSEIGIFNPKDCSYTTVVNDACLGFNTHNLISGKSKYNADCSETVYWADSGLNPRRYLNLQNVPYVNIGEVCDPIYTDRLDCNKILMDPLFTVPYINAEVINEGNLKNGTYQFAIGYSIKKERITDVYSFTNPVSIFSHGNTITKGIFLDIQGLDKVFDEFELFVTFDINNVVSYRSLGFYSTIQSQITISSVDRPEYTAILAENVFVKKQVYEKADWCTGNDKYLLWSGLKAPIEINYQLQAMNILANYVIVEAPSDYYKNDFKLGYYGDETYAFQIQWLKSDGSYSDGYHIPGTIYGSGNTSNLGVNIVANSADVYETSEACSADGIPPGWYVQNGAYRKAQMNIPVSGECDLRIVASGTMAYTESTDLYPNNKDMFGQYVCTPIRHHRFPNEVVEPRFHPYNQSLSGVTGSIRIKSIQFTNIEHPIGSDGNYLKNIVGYRIVRSDRSGNRTVIARGYSTNMRYYNEYSDPYAPSPTVTSTIYYPNYPYNYLGTDPYLGDNGFYSTADRGDVNGLTQISNLGFVFYSPHTLIGQVALSSEVIFEADDYGTVIGQFTEVYQHPAFKLWTDAGLTHAAGVAAAKVLLDIGTSLPILKQTVNTTFIGGTWAGTAGGGPLTATVTVPIVTSSNETPLSWGTWAVAALAGAGGYIQAGIVAGNQYMDIVNNTVSWQNYTIQYNSSCLFNNTVARTSANGRRRFIKDYSYLGDGLNVIPNQPTFYVNNFKKPRGVRIELSNNIISPSVPDTSVFVAGSRALNTNITSTASLYYTSIKRRIPNQYGPLDSFKLINTGYEQSIPEISSAYNPITNPLYYKVDPIKKPIFGGDCFINRFSVNQEQLFWKNFPLNTPNGVIWDYRNYRNLAFPSFWINSQPYDLIEEITGFFNSVVTGVLQVLAFLGTNTSNIALSYAPESRYSLDNYTGGSTKDILRTPAYMYDSYNGAVYHYVESDYNLEFRDYRSNTSNIYQINLDPNYIFQSNNYFLPEEFVYDMSYSKQNTEIFAIQQDLDFKLKTSIECTPYWSNSVIYSLPIVQGIKQDNWLYYLPNNIYTFPLNDFGNLISIHPIDNQQIIFFFDKSAPYMSIGRDQLQTQGNVKVTIGDAGLFDREPRPIEYTDYGFGTCTSRFAFAPTAYGNYFPSQTPGKVFMQSGNRMKEISKEGNKYWFSEYLPSQLLKQFPDFVDKDNPVVGVGMTSIYDPTNERYILTKRDYKCLDSSITYISGQNKFVKDGEREVSLSNKEYFEDASWTISYKGDVGVFVAWHDYHPMSYLQGGRHFMSIQGSTIYKHDEVYNSYCNFYNMDYPFAVQLPINNEVNIESIRSVEFYAETYVYKNQWDYFHVLDTTFDYALISNSEQVSGWLHLNSIVRNQVSQQFLYPYYNTIANQYEVKIDKVENKYRFNQFWDITKDRGEYSGNQFNLISTESNGYIFDLNPLGIDYAKPQTQRKKFRHKTAKLYLEKEVSNDNKITLHFTDTKQTKSPR